MAGSPQLQALLSRRIRQRMPERWRAFANLWMAFNALYGGDPDEKERSRVMRTVRSHVSAKDARHLLSRHRAAIARITSAPPGDMRRESWDPRFRAASRRCIQRYESQTEPVQGKLAAVAGLLYQVRCNLLHGSKDPDSARDRMLVSASLEILEDLVPAIESSMLNFDR